METLLQFILVICILIGFAVCASAAIGSWGMDLAIRQRWGKWQ